MMAFVALLLWVIELMKTVPLFELYYTIFALDMYDLHIHVVFTLIDCAVHLDTMANKIAMLEMGVRIVAKLLKILV